MTSASSDVDFDDYGVFGYQLEPEYKEEELRQIEEAASAQRREIENNQFLCRRIFRHFFDREIVRIFFSLKFCLANVKTILLLFNILRNN